MTRWVRTPDGRVRPFEGNPSDADIIAALEAEDAVSGTAPPVTMTGANNPAAGRMGAVMGQATRAMPAVGGAIGGTIGSVGGYPGRVAGAGIGGAGGEVLRQVVTGDQSLAKVGQEAAWQAGYEAAGGAIAGGLGKLARPTMRRALKPGNLMAPKRFPEVVETALEKGVTATEGGFKKAEALRIKSVADLHKILEEAKLKGVKLSSQKVIRYVNEMLTDKANTKKERKAIAKLAVKFLRDQGRSISPPLLNRITQKYQGLAKAAYNAAVGGAPDAVTGTYPKNLARGAAQELRRVPGVKETKEEMKRLVGLQRALEKVITRDPTVFNPIQPGSYPIINSPHLQSRLALLLNHRAFKEIMRQSPRAGAALIKAMTEPDTPDASRSVAEARMVVDENGNLVPAGR